MAKLNAWTDDMLRPGTWVDHVFLCGYCIAHNVRMSLCYFFPFSQIPDEFGLRDTNREISTSIASMQ